MKKNFFSMPTPEELYHLTEFCKIMAASPFYKKLGPGGVMSIYLTAKEYDLPFMACLNGGLHDIEGKITFSGGIVNALILKAGHKADLVHSDENSCTIHFTRGDRTEPEYKGLTFTYTREDARIAGYLNKNNWRTSPKPMLFNRCIIGGARICMAEVMLGVLLSGELTGTTSDENIMPDLLPVQTTNLLPNSSQSSNNLLANSAACQDDDQPVTYEKDENWNEFCEKHAIKDGTESFLYLQQICANSKKKDFTLTVNRAIAAEETFLEMFEKWKAKRKKAVIDSNEILG